MEWDFTLRSCASPPNIWDASSVSLPERLSITGFAKHWSARLPSFCQTRTPACRRLPTNCTSPTGRHVQDVQTPPGYPSISLQRPDCPKEDRAARAAQRVLTPRGVRHHADSPASSYATGKAACQWLPEPPGNRKSAC